MASLGPNELNPSANAKGLLWIDKSALGQVMAWCHQATSHYLSQGSPRSLSTYGITGLQSVTVVVELTVLMVPFNGLSINKLHGLPIINRPSTVTIIRSFGWVNPEYYHHTRSIFCVMTWWCPVWLFLSKGVGRSSSCPGSFCGKDWGHLHHALSVFFLFFIVVVVVCFVKGLNGQHAMHEMDLYGTSQDLSRQFVKWITGPFLT